MDKRKDTLFYPKNMSHPRSVITGTQHTLPVMGSCAGL